VLDLSVIICTHDPRADYLGRTLAALEAQTLGAREWELIIIDNCSRNAIETLLECRWHPNFRIIREDELGLTAARIRGIREAMADLLVFVDDDNVLSADYLTRVIEIGREWPAIGAWGGECLPEFECTPPEWTQPYWGMLAIRTFKRDSWSSEPTDNSTPVGAGLCLRKVVARKYTEAAKANPLRRLMDRRGSSLNSGGDTDMAFLVTELGFGLGVFKRLQLTHLIPSFRLTEEYLVKLAESMSYSRAILNAIYGRTARGTFQRKIINIVYALTSRRRERKFRLATIRGESAANRFLKKKTEWLSDTSLKA